MALSRAVAGQPIRHRESIVQLRDRQTVRSGVEPCFVGSSPSKIAKYNAAYPERERMRASDLPAATQLAGPTAPTRPLDEIDPMGDEIYERDLRSQVEAANRGQIVAIDVDSGSWAIADSALAAAARRRAQRSDAAKVWLLRVGYRAIASIGGGSLGNTGDRRACEAVVTLPLQGKAGQTPEIEPWWTLASTGSSRCPRRWWWSWDWRPRASPEWS